NGFRRLPGQGWTADIVTGHTFVLPDENCASVHAGGIQPIRRQPSHYYRSLVHGLVHPIDHVWQLHRPPDRWRLGWNGKETNRRLQRRKMAPRYEREWRF